MRKMQKKQDEEGNENFWDMVYTAMLKDRRNGNNNNIDSLKRNFVTRGYFKSEHYKKKMEEYRKKNGGEAE